MSRPGVVGREWFSLNQAFHLKLHEMSGSELLACILQALWRSTGPYFRIFADDERAVARANSEHEMLLSALRKGNRRDARRVLRNHLKTGLNGIRPALDTQE
jgi:DNA-binding GntR family transcriptional regulator